MLVRKFVKKTLSEHLQLRQYVRNMVLREAEEEKQFSKYFGINVLNHDVLSQIKDDIHTATKSLGDNDEFVDFFKRYVLMYLSDLIETSFDVDDIDNEIEQIKGVLAEQVRLEVNPDKPNESPIDPELLQGDEPIEEEGDEESDKLNQVATLPTKEIDSPEDRGLKRQQMELDNGGQQDAKKQALDLMNNIDDIIIAGYDKISDKLNKELFVRYLVINILLHIDKAHKMMQEEPPDVEMPEYEEPVPEQPAEELPL